MKNRLMNLSFLILVSFATLAHATVTRYMTGNPKDVNPQVHGPAYHFQGGGTDVDAAFQWLFDQVRGCTDCDTKLDVVILRASGENGYNDYLYAMKGVDSVETLVITDREDAKQPDVIETIKNAEIIFFAGGDQCNYTTKFKGTPIQTAVESVVERGGGIGGTSAGEAIQGEFVYDACTSTGDNGTTTEEALKDPYDPGISFTYDFFHWKFMEKTMTDQHLVERKRMGRTLSFLARQIQDGKTQSILGVAIERETTLLVGKDGIGHILGKGPAYFILADHPPEVCKPKQPLTYSNYKIWKLNSGGTFDLKNRPTTGYYLRSITKGAFDSDPYEGPIYQ